MILFWFLTIFIIKESISLLHANITYTVCIFCTLETATTCYYVQVDIHVLHKHVHVLQNQLNFLTSRMKKIDDTSQIHSPCAWPHLRLRSDECNCVYSQSQKQFLLFFTDILYNKIVILLKFKKLTLKANFWCLKSISQCRCSQIHKYWCWHKLSHKKSTVLYLVWVAKLSLVIGDFANDPDSLLWKFVSSFVRAAVQFTCARIGKSERSLGKVNPWKPQMAKLTNSCHHLLHVLSARAS